MSGPQPSPAAIPCRICGLNAQFFFSKVILGSLNAAYFKCGDCGHVQTETPYWLQEAYQNMGLDLDVGMADRSLWTAQTMVALAGRLGISAAEPCLDWGAGTGLFVRFCRDYGMNFFYRDPYAQNIFARGFEFSQAGAHPSWACISAFEVAEHLPDPLNDFAALFEASPRHILFSTLLYLGQDSNWWYFGDNGQHVAFYTRKSLEIIGQRYGYQLASNDCDLHLFSRERVSDRLLGSCRKAREKLARKYQKKNGSRILGDFEHVKAELLQKKSATT